MAKSKNSFKSKLQEKFIDLSEKFLETGNPDTFFAGHNGQLIDMMTTLAEDNKFNMDMLYKEGFLTEATLDESIDNWSTYLNFERKRSTPAKVSMVCLLSTSSDVPYRVQLKKNSKWKVGTTFFTLPKNINIINFSNNRLVAFSEDEDGNTQLPLKYVFNPGTQTFDLLVKNILLEQFTITTYTNVFPVVTTHEFITFTIDISADEDISDIDIRVDGEEYEAIENSEEWRNTPKAAVINIKGNKLFVTFGNGILGTLPISGSQIEIDAKLTKGNKGAVAAGDISIVNASDIVTAGSVTPDIFTVLPANAEGGTTEDKTAIKFNSIKEFRTNRRFVTDTDIKDFFDLLGLSIPVFIRRTRCDVVKTEVTPYITIPDVNSTVAPVSTEDIEIDLPVSQLEHIMIPKGSVALIDDEFNFSVPYELFINTNSNRVLYRSRVPNPALTFKQLAEFEENTTSEAFFSLSDTLSQLDESFPLLNQDKVTYDLTLNHIFNDTVVDGIHDFSIEIIPESDFTIAQPDLENTEFYNGIATVENQPIDLSSFTQAAKDDSIFDATGTIELAKFASNVDIGQISRKINYNTGFIPAGNPEVIIIDLPSAGTTINTSFTTNSIILDDTKARFKILVNKNFEKLKFRYKISKDLQTGGGEVLIDYSLNSTKLQPMDIELMNSIAVIDAPNNKITINKVPVIETEYYNNNIIDVDPFLNLISGIIQNEYSSKRMQNIDINLKFAKTFGFIKNIFLNNEEKIYSSDPKWNARVFFDVEIFPDPTVIRDPQEIIDDVKTTILDYVNDQKDYHAEIITSRICAELHAIDGVKFANILSPIDNIVYNFDFDKLTKQQIVDFVPEFIYTTIDSINVNILENL